MTGRQSFHAEINGRAASAEQVRDLALHNYGHFTAMQVRAGAVRGLDLHLGRLAAASREMFGAEPGRDRVRDHIRHAIADTADASVRTVITWPDGDDDMSVLVMVRPPADMATTPQSLRSVPYQRPLPHIKQVGGGFGQSYYRAVAHRAGYAEALLTGPGGVVSEGGITNVGFVDGTGVVWPDAPALDGITMLLLESRLPDAGLPSRRGEVRLADLPAFDAVFVTNSRGIAPVDRVDDVDIPVHPGVMKTVADVYDAVPWDRI
jgi:branched-subunit amino acid aminotransferase/4-amino-4-deoxychorismate lyase